MNEKDYRYGDQKRLDFSNIRTWSVSERKNLVTIDNMSRPQVDEVPDWNSEGFEELVERIIKAVEKKRPVIWSMGAHVIKNGLSRYIIELVKKGVITHISGNGAVSIHDFELAFNGGTSEDVPNAIEDGSFGMWEETGKWMNEAIIEGAKLNLGYGESLAKYIDKYINRFPYKEDCVVYQAYKHGIPATYHIAIGTDIIHQHPTVNFAAIGPEVFLKALSISRNMGFCTFNITTANFDLVDLGDYRKKIGYDDPHYYYRPRKNIINRPTSKGGKGWHFCGDHKVTIPNLYKKVLDKLGG